MKKTVYHGSDHIIERPKYGYGKIYNDYGVGFYCTENQNMAKEWGVSADKNGYANRYEIECDASNSRFSNKIVRQWSIV